MPALMPALPMRLRVWVRTCVLLYVLPAVPFWLLASWYFIDRPLVSLDAALAVLLMGRWPRTGAAVLVLAWVADLAVGLAVTYHFTRPLEFVLSSRFLDHLQWGQVLAPTTLVAAALFVGVAAGIWSWRKAGPIAPGCALGVGLALVAADTLNGSSGLWLRGLRTVPLNVVGSPLHTLGVQLATLPQAMPLGPVRSPDTVAGRFGVEAWAQQNPGRGIVLVVVESLGWVVNDEVRAWLERRLLGAAGVIDGYRSTATALPFKGATTAAELRHLCALYGPYESLTPELGRQCLPQRLQRMGWTPLGLHGFSRKMFDRETWWPITGLADARFADDAAQRALPRCGGAFRGVCDTELLRQAFAHAAQPRHFAYVLTLNTHLPLAARTVPADLDALCARTHHTAPACQLVAALGDLLSQVRNAADAARPRPLVLVVGDHAPPFARRDERDRFSQTQVPAFALVPQAAEAPAHPPLATGPAVPPSR